jgi:ATP adenylyltransferase
MSEYLAAQQLWAPWRMEFIRAPREGGCFLCRIIGDGAEKDVDNLVIRRGRHGLLLLNRYPYNGGHLMAAPYRHVGTLGELTDDERKELMDLACLAERLLTAVVRPHGFNMGINQGAAAGAGLKDHLHMHIVPRWEGDTNFMPVVGSVRVMPQALEEMHEALREALAGEERA